MIKLGLDDREVNKVFDKIEAITSRAVTRFKNELDAAGDYIEGEVKTDNTRGGNTPVITGRLAGSYRKKVYQSGWSVAVGTNLDYAPAVEFGTSAHVIRVKNASVLTDGKTFFGKEVMHPGTKAQPHLYPAYRKGRKRFLKKVKKIFKR